MTEKSFAIVEAPSVLGLFPKGVETLPDALLAAGLAERLGARRAGRVEPPPYEPQRDPETLLLNPRGIADYSVALADAIGAVVDRGEFPVVLGGDCSVLLGDLLALRRRGRYGLLFLDGHADFYQPEAEPNGEAASMDLALVTGRGPVVVTDIEGRCPLVRDEDVVVFGRRDAADAEAHGSQRIEDTTIAITDLGAVRAAEGLPPLVAQTGSHAVAIIIAFAVITTLHIVLGELAPKSLALQRSEGTALWVVRPLGLFRFLLWPAIVTLNGLGNLLLRLCGLRPGTGEGSVHSPEELKLLISASQEAGILQQAQQEVIGRVFNIGNRSISDIMTPRLEVAWINADNSPEEMRRIIRGCRHEQLVVSRGTIDEILGVVRKQDLLDQTLGGKPLDPLAVMREALVVHEATRILKVLEHFKRQPVGMAIVVDEYGSLEGIVTQTDLLEAIAGDIPSSEDAEPEIVEREDGSLLIDGMMSANEAFDRLHIRNRPKGGDFNTLAGFALFQLGRIPSAGDHFRWEGWRFEIVDMDGRRVDKLLVLRDVNMAQRL